MLCVYILILRGIEANKSYFCFWCFYSNCLLWFEADSRADLGADYEAGYEILYEAEVYSGSTDRPPFAVQAASFYFSIVFFLYFYLFTTFYCFHNDWYKVMTPETCTLT